MNEHLLKIKGLTTVSAQFPGSKRAYTYWTTEPIEVGVNCIVQTPKRWSSVLITAVHETPQIDPKAKFEYKRLGQPVRIRQVDSILFTAYCDKLSIKADGPTAEFALSNLVNKFEMVFPTQTPDTETE